MMCPVALPSCRLVMCRKLVHLLHHQNVRCSGVCHHHDYPAVPVYPAVVHLLRRTTHRRPVVSGGSTGSTTRRDSSAGPAGITSPG